MKWRFNKQYCKLSCERDDELSDVFRFHMGMTGYYKKTLEKEIVANVYIKDESNRMNTNSFKILGVSYSIYKMYEDKCRNKGFSGLLEYFSTKRITFVTATDGNFGIAVSYFCNLLKQKCIVFIPMSTPLFYINKIKQNKAEIVFCSGDYGDCVENAIKYSKYQNVTLILDTSTPSEFMNDVARYVIKGYTTIFFESNEKKYDYIFVPAGVGGLVAATIQYNLYIKNKLCKVISVEPETYNCIQESIINGHPTKVKGNDTIMNGLKCGAPSWFAWEYIYKGLYGGITISDTECVMGKLEMERYGLNTGYTGASAYAGYKAFCKDHIEELKNKNILILNTECSE